MNLLQRILSWFFGSPASIPARTEPRPPGMESARTEPRPPGDLGAEVAATEWPEFQPEIPPIAKKVGAPLGLDAADYLPITGAEIKEAARGQNLRSNPWFGNRNLIPPADDPRTRLIDRAMVTQGLITPEELAEIHTVGAEMDRVRPTLASIEHRAMMTGEAAVQADREASAQLKARKKAEAAERKRLAGRSRRPAQGRGHPLPRPGRLGPAGRAGQPRR